MAAERPISQHIDEFLRRWGGYGATTLGELRSWGEHKYDVRRTEFRQEFKRLAQRIRQGEGSIEEIMSARGPRHRTVFSRKSMRFSSTGLPGFEAGRVSDVESDVRRWVAGRGFDAGSPFLPGGADLTWDELQEMNLRLGEAYGFDRLIDRLAEPAVLKPGRTPPSPFYWVLDPARGENRAFARVAVPRRVLLQTDDPGLIALTQSTFQYRPERAELTGAGPAEVFPSSGRRPTLEVINRLAAQKRQFMTEQGTRVIFDLETASLRPEHGIRQLSARFVNELGEEVGSAVNLHFANGIMGLGAYGRPLTEVLGVQAGDLIPQTQVAESLIDFFERAGQARYMIGQNAYFDVAMLAQLKKDSLYQEAEQLIREGVTPTSDRQQLAMRLKTAADRFFERAHSDAFVDTAAHARILLSAVGGRPIEVAEEFLLRGEGKQFSIENIMLQSSFLRDALELKLTTPSALQSALEGGALHSADVDTWFTELLARVQSSAYRGTRLAGGQEVLRPERLGEEALRLIYEGAGEIPDVAAFRARITGGGAITPFTRLSADALAELGPAGRQLFTAEQLRTARITPLEQMILLSRGFSPAGAPSDVMAVRGIWREFSAQQQLVAEQGRLNPLGLFPNADEFAKYQERLRAAGIPFAELSLVERMLSSVMGSSDATGLGPGVRQMRRALGEVTGVGMWQATDKVRVFRRGNVALPFELVERMAREGGPLAGALAGPDAVQYFGISAFNARSARTKFRNVKDVALTLDAFSEDPEMARNQMRGVIDFLSSLTDDEKIAYGITPKVLQEMEAGLGATARSYGVQVATLGGAKGNATARAVYNMLEDLNFTADRRRTAFVLPMLGRVANYIQTGPFLSTAGDVIFRDDQRQQVFEMTERLKGLTADMEANIAGNPRRLAELGETARAGGEIADRMPAMFDQMRRVLTARRLGIGTVAAAAGYYLYRQTQPKPGEETLAQQPYETPAFYERYRADLGLPAREAIPIVGRTPRDPLATAHLPAYLDNNKIGHTRMGPNKDRHLYAGV